MLCVFPVSGLTSRNFADLNCFLFTLSRTSRLELFSGICLPYTRPLSLECHPRHEISGRKQRVANAEDNGPRME